MLLLSAYPITTSLDLSRTQSLSRSLFSSFPIFAEPDVMQSERLQKAWRREHTRFKHDYNDKLYNGLVLLLLVDILMFRFVIKFSILESLGWVVFLFLQV